MHTYKKKGEKLWVVFFCGSEHTGVGRSFDNEDDAATYVHYLNGGVAGRWPLPASESPRGQAAAKPTA